MFVCLRSNYYYTTTIAVLLLLLFHHHHHHLLCVCVCDSPFSFTFCFSSIFQYDDILLHILIQIYTNYEAEFMALNTFYRLLYLLTFSQLFYGRKCRFFRPIDKRRKKRLILFVNCACVFLHIYQYWLRFYAFLHHYLSIKLSIYKYLTRFSNPCCYSKKKKISITLFLCVWKTQRWSNKGKSKITTNKFVVHIIRVQLNKKI